MVIFMSDPFKIYDNKDNEVKLNYSVICKMSDSHFGE